MEKLNTQISELVEEAKEIVNDISITSVNDILEIVKMSSTQSKMRTNGVFLRNFDSKRYQELQAQKQKILDKQKELIKIKEKKDAKKKEQDGTASDLSTGTETETEEVAELEEIEGEDGSACVDIKVVVNDFDDVDGVIDAGGELKDSVNSQDVSEAMINGNTGENELLKKNGVVGNETDHISEKVKVDTSKVKTAQKADSVTPAKVKQERTQGSGNSKAGVKTVKGNGVIANSNANVIVDNLSKGQVQRGIKKSLSGQNVKEYAIIAKQNQQAIKRETEIVQNTGTGMYATPDTIGTQNSKTQGTNKNQEIAKKLLAKAAKQNKANAEAYAVVDLTVTMNLVNEIKENNLNANTEPVATTGATVAKTSTKSKSGGKGTGYTDYKDIINNYKHHHRMSRSAGYSGDIDTSTSSLEPDYDYSHMDQYLSSKLSLNSLNKDRLVITEEQLNSLQTITSSSSG